MFPTAPETFLPTLRLLLITTMVATGCSGSGNSGAPATAQATGTPGAEQAVGERLFMETRFAQAFKAFLDAGGDVTDHAAQALLPFRVALLVKRRHRLDKRNAGLDHGRELPGEQNQVGFLDRPDLVLLAAGRGLLLQ